MTAPTLSVVIPTHNRRDPLLRLLKALEMQDAAAGSFEAIVVADGCSDDTAPAVRAVRWSFPVVVAEQEAAGPAAARNRGAALASGSILLFLDDDVEPAADVVRRHTTFHEESAGDIGVGDLPPLVREGGFFGIILRGWWEGMNEDARHPGHRYSYRDLLSGHFSIGRTAFERLGGFDSEIRCHEDYELGYRAIESGLQMRFIPSAVARHHEATSLSKTLRRKFEEGVADVRLLQRHPPLGPQLPLARKWTYGAKARALILLAWRGRAIGDAAAAGLRGLLRVYEAARLRFRWRAVLEDLLVYAYWRGVSAACGSRAQLDRLVAGIPPAEDPELVLDLAAGIASARARVDASRPRSLRLVYGSAQVGDVPARAGAEPLRGVHLPRLLVKDFALEYLRAAAAAGALPPALAPVAAASRAAAGTDGAERLQAAALAM